jgi:Uma2 family endonuclease
MGSHAITSVEEYLRTSFPDLDREYRDGELVERSLSDFLHSRTQVRLAAIFEALCKRFPVFTCTELRMKLREGLVLIPDVSVFWPSEPPSVPDFPPLVAIEILSRDDRMAAVREKLEEYRDWGVKHVWLVDPYQRRFYTCDAGLAEVASFGVPELDLDITSVEIFE